MDDFEQTLLEAAKDAFEVLTEDGGNKEEGLEIPFSDVDFEKEEKTSLDDLIKGAVEKTEDQPTKNNPVKEMER